MNRLPNEILLHIFGFVDLPTYCSVIRCCKWLSGYLKPDRYARKDVFMDGDVIKVFTIVGNINHGPYIKYKYDNIVETGTYYKNKYHGNLLRYKDGQIYERSLYEYNISVEYESYRDLIYLNRFTNEILDGECTYKIDNVYVVYLRKNGKMHGLRQYHIDSDIVNVYFDNNILTHIEYNGNTYTESFRYKKGSVEISFNLPDGLHTLKTATTTYTAQFVDRMLHGNAHFNWGNETDIIYEYGVEIYRKSIHLTRITESSCGYKYITDTGYYKKVESICGDIKINIECEGSVVVSESTYGTSGSTWLLLNAIYYSNGVKSISQIRENNHYNLYRYVDGNPVKYATVINGAINDADHINGFTVSEYKTYYNKYCID